MKIGDKTPMISVYLLLDFCLDNALECKMLILQAA